MTAKAYPDSFFGAHLQESINSAKGIIPVVLKYIKPESVIDVGCGTGLWLSIWKEFGIREVLGVDGGYVNVEKIFIEKEDFVPADLGNGFTTNRVFELVCCLEVAEHIRSEKAENLIDSLCNLGDVILFSAAIPGQEGTLHYNEQYPEFWIKLFAKHNFTAYDCIREQVWTNEKISWWYRQNIMFFVRDDAKRKYPLITKEQRSVLSLVHPELLNYKSSKMARYEKILRNPYTTFRYFAGRYFYRIKNLLKK